MVIGINSIWRAPEQVFFRGPIRRSWRWDIGTEAGGADPEGDLGYGRYLRVPELLSLQSPISSPPAHDELLFIVVHQSFELWFKQILYELETARDSMLAADTYPARHYLRRVHNIERMLLDHIGIIESMWPQDFLHFRGYLAPASGFQSAQFREIEFLSGLKEPGLMGRMALSPEEKARLERRLREPTLWEAFCALLEHNGLAMPAGAEQIESRRATLLKIMRDRDAYPELFYTAEGLLTHDEMFVLWRQHHILMVERQIGSKMGTGGSAGVSYLRTTLDKRFYPELWEVRTHL